MTLNRILAGMVLAATLALLPWGKTTGSAAERGELGPSSSAPHVGSVNGDSSRGMLAFRGSNAGAHPEEHANLGRRGARKPAAEDLEFSASLHTGRLIVKFRDNVRARVRQNAVASVTSLAGRELEMDDFRELVQRFDLEVRPVITSVSEDRLENMRREAFERSGRAQPDLAGLLFVTGPENLIEQAARQIHALPIVEYVEFEPELTDPEELRQARHHDAFERDRQAAAEQAQNLIPEPQRVGNGARGGGGDEWIHGRWGDTDLDAPLQRDDTQPAPLRSFKVPLHVESGWRSHRLDDVDAIEDAEPEVIFSDVVGAQNVPWVRVYFGDVTLSGSPHEGTGSFLRITSLLDGAVQVLDAVTLQQWQKTSAYFNGPAVLVELLAYPNTGFNSVSLDRLDAGRWGGDDPPGADGTALNVCPDVPDDREQVDDLANAPDGRLMPVGCTGFLFDGQDHCMISAGHCVAGGGLQVVQFRVPDSLDDGTPVHPDPAYQFSVDPTSIQFEWNPENPNACANDWAYFGAFPNAITGNSMLQTQNNNSYALATEIPSPTGQLLRVQGYGIDEKPPGSTGGRNKYSQTLQFHEGPFLNVQGTRLEYHLHAAPGNSGSATHDIGEDNVIGILTCGTCTVPNPPLVIGTAITHPALQIALNNPQGVCNPDPGACCLLPQEDCVDASFLDCTLIGGVFLGLETQCPTDPDDDNPCEDLEFNCGEPFAGDCFNPFNPSPACANEDCCELVCAFDSFCCAEADDDIDFPSRPQPEGAGNPRWDAICALHAVNLCLPASFCSVINNDPRRPCFHPHTQTGCNIESCCALVTAQDFFCQEVMWDEQCVQIALSVCPNAGPDDPTPDFEYFQGYRTSLDYWQQTFVDPNIPDGEVPTRICEVVPCVGGRPLRGWSGEGYDLQTLWEFGELLPGENRTAGLGIRVGVFFPTAFVHPEDESLFHEDLVGRVQYPETDQTMIFNPLSPSGLLNGHYGTAVLGILAANGENDFGMKGLVPDSDVYFFPTTSEEEGGRFVNAFMSALDIFEPGDVFVVPQLPRTPGAMTSTIAGWSVIRMASDMGIITVVAAGDECRNMGTAPQAGDGEEVDSNAILVGGTTPGWPYFRWGPSNYCDGAPCAAEEAVHIGGWGEAVATLGFGDLFLARDGDGGIDVTRSYTARFEGTAAAAAMVGAMAARLQGLSKQFYGIPLAPNQLRGELAGNGFLQASLLEPPGSPAPFPCGGDWSLDEPPNRIGSVSWPDPFDPSQALVAQNAFTDMPLAAEFIVVGGYFDDCDDLKAAHTIRGELVLGNVFSVCQPDGVVYTIESQPTSGSSSPSFVPPGYEGPVGNVVYRANGQLADLFVVGQASSTFISSYAVTATIAPTNVQTIVGLELYDFVQGRWIFTTANIFGPGEGGVIATPPDFTFNPGRFFNSDGESLVRVWGFTFGVPPSPGGAPGNIPFEFNIDAVQLSIETFGSEPEE